MDVNSPGFHINIVAPDRFQQIFAGKDLARRFHQRFQQPKFGRPQMDIAVAAENFFLGQIHFDIFKTQFLFLKRFRGATQVGAVRKRF